MNIGHGENQYSKETILHVSFALKEVVTFMLII